MLPEGKWFTEHCNLWYGCALSIKLRKSLFDKKSKFQHIQIFDTESCGRMLVLDSKIQCTEYDEFAYHEMITHVPAFSHKKPENILIIGGGDGGAARELLKHSSVKRIDICEIDREVIRASEKYLPSISNGSLKNPKVKIYCEDALDFIKSRKGKYDIIICDASDPEGPAELIFEEEFIGNMKLALKKDGILSMQAESFFMHRKTVEKLAEIFRRTFKFSAYSWFAIPTYPGGTLGIMTGSSSTDCRSPLRHATGKILKTLKYYNSKIHENSFVLPQDFAATITKKNRRKS